MLEIIPGINEEEWSEIEKKIELVLPFAKTIHIDLEDGTFGERKTFLNPEPFKKYAGTVNFELHMMVDEPIKYLKDFADAGFKRFMGHIERMSDQIEFVAQGQLLGEVGLALDGPTPIDRITVPYDDLDNILIYTGERVGPSGVELLEKRLLKVQQIREKSPYIAIEVDGGINDENILKAERCGATRFASTGFIFNSDNAQEAYEKLREEVFKAF